MVTNAATPTHVWTTTTKLTNSRVPQMGSRSLPRYITPTASTARPKTFIS